MSARMQFAYMQARCQAHFSLQLRGEWERLSALRDPVSYLAAVLRKPFHRSLARLSAAMSTHETEGLLRDTFRRIVNEVAGWMPAAWRPAVQWSALLADLPAIGFLMQGGDAYPWIRRDRRMQMFLKNPVSSESPPDAAIKLVLSLGREASAGMLPVAWARYWRKLWPPSDGGTRKQLLHLQNVVLQARRRLTNPGESSRVQDAGLEREFIRIFRGHIQTPAAAFAYIGLSWLELTRLRAGLIERQLPPHPS